MMKNSLGETIICEQGFFFLGGWAEKKGDPEHILLLKIKVSISKVGAKK